MLMPQKWLEACHLILHSILAQKCRRYQDVLVSQESFALLKLVWVKGASETLKLGFMFRGDTVPDFGSTPVQVIDRV